MTKMLVADSARSDAVSENIKAMQRECVSMLEVLAQYIEMLDRPAPPGTPQDPRARGNVRRSLDRERAAAAPDSNSSSHDIR